MGALNYEMSFEMCGLLRCPVYFVASARNAPGEIRFSHVYQLGLTHAKMQNLDGAGLSASLPRVQPGARVVRVFPT